MTQNPELSRPIRVDTLGSAPRMIAVRANQAERDALATRFGLVALDRLEAEVSVHSTNQDVIASGRLVAEVVQSCVATAAPVPDRIDEAFAVRFRIEAPGRPEEEVELGEAEMDVIFYDGAMADVGEAVAQTLALALDPYPRAEGASDALKQAGVKDEGEAGPFGALAGLKDKLGK